MRHLRSVVLGSASPRRRELLERAGLVVEVTAAEIDEATLPGELPPKYLERVVAAKLAAVRARVNDPSKALIVADTSVLLGDRILGKPTSNAEAHAMVASLAGRTHRVATRFAVAYGSGIVAETVETEVEFRRMTDEDVAWYVATGEGRDKAGAYAIQGIGAMFVRRIVGSYTNVVGLPLAEVLEALEHVALAAKAVNTPRTGS